MSCGSFPMARIKLQGSPRHIALSTFTLVRISIVVALRRMFGKPLVPQWPFAYEVSNLFWRFQFNHAFSLPSIAEGRAYFDSLQTLTDDVYGVDRLASKAGEPKGHWFIPRASSPPTTMLYLHGGGYAFYAAVTSRLIETLTASLDVRVFAPDYRLTPEHQHPAQIVDALAAYRFLLEQGVDPRRLVVAGDSAGGHLALMLLLAVRDAALPQPAIAIGICPWTDIGDRGASLFGNDRYDLVQGYMALKFGEWLKGSGSLTNAQLSPIDQDFRGVAPIYLQGGGKEIPIDMIRDFAATVRGQGAAVMLDVWEHMTHDFQASGSMFPESREALHRMRTIVGDRGVRLTIVRNTDRPSCPSMAQMRSAATFAIPALLNEGLP
jgi:epsilon-lactone hydrolase